MKFLKYILEILFPVSCVSCGASINDEKTFLCQMSYRNSIYILSISIEK
ncbi:MAG: hypothetical protein IPI15_18175 [Saprospiraceae bacterium]|nr:hypothetical protein [Candidatus Brachybacter algidus]MBK7605452.1 hypothetical protein [Candidatus Brachybacter algidus]